MNQPIVTQLKIYPLKSAKGISLPTMEITPTGPRYDREWMLVDKNLNFISQRTHPQMGQLNSELTDENLIISSPHGESVNIPLKKRFSETLVVNIFKKPTLAEKIGSNVSQWFSDYLKQEVQLVRSPQTPERKTSGNHGPVTPLLFPDGYPLLLTNEATLDELNEKLDHPVIMDRFRPNIVIKGATANEEDQWSSFQIGDIPFLSVKACTRCAIIDIDPTTSAKSKEVSRTLKTYRTKDSNIVFGCNLTHQGTGAIHIGAIITDIN